MPRTPARFTQADVARAIRAARSVGDNSVVELTLDGTIRILREKAATPENVEPDAKICL